MVRSSAKFLEWSKRIARFERSDIALAKFCNDENVAIHSFYYWKKRITSNASLQRTHFDAKKPLESSFESTQGTHTRCTIHVGSIKIECDLETSHALGTVLAWAASQSGSSMFHPLIVQN